MAPSNYSSVLNIITIVLTESLVIHKLFEVFLCLYVQENKTKMHTHTLRQLKWVSKIMLYIEFFSGRVPANNLKKAVIFSNIFKKKVFKKYSLWMLVPTSG